MKHCAILMINGIAEINLSMVFSYDNIHIKYTVVNVPNSVLWVKVHFR